MNIEKKCEQTFEESKLNILGEVMWAFGTIASPWWMGFLGGDFVIFRPKVGKILNFESILSLEIIYL